MKGLHSPLRAAPAAATALPWRLHGLFANSPIERIGVHDVLYREETEPGFLFAIAEGCVRRFTMRHEGRRSIIGFAFAGDYCGDPFEGGHAMSAEAVTPVKVRRISRAQFRSAVAHHPEIGAEVLQLACRELARMNEHAMLLGLGAAHSRLASFLVSFEERLAPAAIGRRAIHLPMGRLDLADFLGLTIESVSRAFTQLKSFGVISLDGTNEVVIENISALRQIAEGRKIAPKLHSSQAQHALARRSARVLPVRIAGQAIG